VAQDVHLHTEEPLGDASMDLPAGATLLFVNQHYAPDVAATGQCLADLAEHLVRDGYEVEVLAGRTSYGAGHVESRPSEVRNGVKVTRVATTGFGRRTHLGRVIDYASFYVAVLVRLLFGKRYDGVVFLTTPPLIAFIGRVVRVLRGQRYAIWSMDLHPEAEVAAGMLTERSVVARVLGWLDARAYRGADFVVDLGPYMRERVLRKGVLASRAHTVNIWGGRGDSTPVIGPNPLTTHLGLEDRFVVMYSGNAGIVHDFGAIFEAMRELRDDPRVFFLFVGDGPRRAEVEAFARAEQVDNFVYRDYFPRELLRHSLSVADVHLISLRPQFVGVSVPSKLYGAMASGRPIVFIGPRACETADAIRDARCGITVDPRDGGDAAAGRKLAEILLGWADVRSVREELGARGRCTFLERYDHRLSCAEFESVVRSVWGRQGTLRRDGRTGGRLSSAARWPRASGRRAASDPPAATH
jgi:glycosyltransferase involved in cell wall biosynthesis